MNLDTAAYTLTIQINLPSSRFVMLAKDGTHPVYDSVIKRFYYLNFFQHECYKEMGLSFILSHWRRCLQVAF